MNDINIYGTVEKFIVEDKEVLLLLKTNQLNDLFEKDTIAINLTEKLKGSIIKIIIDENKLNDLFKGGQIARKN